MKRALAWLLLLALVMGVFAGCGDKTNTPAETTTQSTTENVTEDQTYTGPSAQDAIEYLESLYQNEGATIGADYSRYSTIRVGGQAFEVEWTASLSEDQIKIVYNDDGTCTIDINEENEIETPYVLTATITDPNGESASHSWNYILPEGVKVEEVLKAAYALKDGEVLPYQVTLRGEVEAITERYKEEYNNLNCTIVVPGFEDMPILCYRLKGEAAKDVLPGNIITVTGTIKNYKGTIEFDSGCVIDKLERGNPVYLPVNHQEIVDLAYQMDRGKRLRAPVTLTGIITSIDTPYDEVYDNITVTIAIPGRLNKPIMCYRMKGENLDELKTSDEITVIGCIVNYNGTREFDSGCELLKCVPGSGHVQPKDPVQVVKEAYALPLAGNLLYTAELTGTITKINTKYSASYGNITVTFVVEGAEDMPIQCYRMTGDNTKLSKLKVGDTITVRGLIKNYYRFSSDSSTIQYDKPEMVDCVFNAGGSTVVNSAMKPISGVKPGVAYKFGFRQNNLTGKPFQMITGAMDGYYGETVTNAAQAVDTYVEETAGGYYIYTLKGTTKKYINITVNGTYYNVSFDAKASSVWQLNEQYDYVYTTCTDGTDVYLGTYGQNSTLGASKTSYIADTSKIGKSQFCAWFLEVDPDGNMGGDSGSTLVPELAGEPKTGTAYKFGLTQGNAGNKQYFITGDMDGYYMGTTEEAATAADVYLEETSGGYYLYTTAGGKKYINMVVSGTHVNAAFEDTATTVYTYNTEKKTVTATVNDTLYMHGTRNDKSYTTAGPVKVELDGFPCQFYTMVEGEGTGTGDAGFVADPKAETAYKLGLQQNGKDGAIYYFTGEESGNYLATSTSAASAADVYMETATGGYKLYVLKSGVKYYITIEKNISSSNKTYYNPRVRTADEMTPSVWVLNTQYKYMTTTHSDGTEVVMGTYSTYTTISCSKSSFISDPSVIGESQFCAWFLDGTGSGSGGGTTPTPSAGFVADPKAETAYKLGLQQNGKDGAIYYFTGEESGNYLATSTSAASAADVYMETATGGYKLYVLKGGVKYYITIEKNISSSNKTYYNPRVRTADEMTPSVWVLNTQYKYMTTTHSDGTEVVMGTYSTYTTISCSKSSFISDPSVIGESQFCAWFLDGTGSGGTVTPPATGDGFVADPKAETAYKLGLQQNGVDGKVYYFTGEESGNYLATSKNASEAADVYMETATGGYKLYVLKGGVKYYITIEKNISSSNKTYYNPRVRTADEMTPSVWVLNKTHKYMTTTHSDGTEVVMGTYSTYTTISCSKSSFISDTSVIGVSQFCAWFLDGTGSGSGGGTVTPPATSDGFVADPQAETAYKLGLQQNGVDGAVYYFTGEESGNYLGTSKNASEAADVYMETATGGYKLYVLKGGVKTYITIEKSISSSNGKTYYNAKLRTADEMTPSVWVLNTQYKYLTTTHEDGTEVVMGTYSTYTTISCSKSSFISDTSVIGVSQFCVWFLESTGTGSGSGGTVTPPAVEPVTGTKYTFANYAPGTNNYAGSEEHKLDDNVTVTVYNKAWFNTQLRLYNYTSANYLDAHAVLKFSKPVTKLTLNVGYNEGTLMVWVSNDGTNWTALSDVAVSASYADKTIDLGGAYTYVKLQATPQIRIIYFIAQFKEN